MSFLRKLSRDKFRRECGNKHLNEAWKKYQRKRYSIRPYSIISIALFTLEVFAVGAALAGVAYLTVFAGEFIGRLIP